MHFFCKEDLPLISVIVPVYNVEKYLKECVDSIINQTYKNLEIILVDDGSTDSSGRMCDEFVDDRIHVIHKDNEGPSAARNVAISVACGRYLTFVDSDDCISRRMIENMMRIMLNENVGIVCCTSSNEKKDVYNGENLKWHYMSGREARARMLEDFGYRSFVWGKLYKKEMFDKATFPEGEIFEDIIPNYNALKNVDSVAIIEEVLYFYRLRSDSLTGDKSCCSSDRLKAVQHILHDCKINDKEYFEYMIPGCAAQYLYHMNSCYRIGCDDKDISKCLCKLSRKYNKKIKKASGLRRSTKYGILLFAVSPGAYRVLYSIYHGSIRNKKYAAAS